MVELAQSPRPGPPRWAWAAAGTVVAVAAGRMALLVWSADRLPYNDYWPMLDSMLTSRGGFRWAGVFEFRNEHPVVAAKLLYWANLKLTGGSNVALGLAIVAVVLGQVAVVVALARDLAPRWRWAPPLVVAAAGILLFGRQGAWHFMKSMSGAAWLTANLFAVSAVWAQYRGRRGPAIALAALASVSYGTGLVAWPALLVVGVLTGERARRLLPTLAAGLVAAAWFQWQLDTLERNPVIRPPLSVLLAHASEVIGAFFFPHHRVTSIRVGEAIVGVATASALVAVARLVGRRDPMPAVAAPWIGLQVYGVGMAVLVAGGRSDYLWRGTAGRYSAIAALTCIGLVGLAAATAPIGGPARRAVRALWSGAVVVLCLVVFHGGGEEVRALDGTHAGQDLLAVALNTGLFGGSTLWLGGLEATPLGIEGRVGAAGQELGMRPSIDCGRLGDVIGIAEIEPGLPPGVAAEVVRLGLIGDLVPGAIRFDGWVDGGSLECVVLVNPEGTVVGAAGHGSARHGYACCPELEREGRVWFSGLAPSQDGTTVYARFEGSNGFVALPYAG